MNYEPASRLNLSTSNLLGWANGLLVWLLNWANQNFLLLAILGGGVLVSKVFRIKLNVGGK